MTARIVERLFTIEEWEQHSTESDRRFELVKGRLAEMAPPTNRHTRAVNKLWMLLYMKLPEDLCEVMAGSGVATERGLLESSRIPDVFVLQKAGFDPDMRTNDPADVLLAVEVVSDSTERDDRIVKRAEYEHAQVANYWIVDVREKTTSASAIETKQPPKLTVLTLVDGAYQERACGPDAQGQVLIPDLAGVQVAFHWDDLVN